MSYQERRALVSLASSVLIPIVYSAVMIQRYPSAADPYSIDVFRFWGAYFVLLIVVTIIARIFITIVFSILNTIATREGEPGIEDERDKLIDLKANRNASYVFGIGFVLAMAALVFDLSPSVMFIILLCGGIASDILSEAASFFFYRRGV